MKRENAASILAGVAALCLVAWQVAAASRHGALFVDLRAFYCGGWTVLHHGNPYDAAPLLTCEQTPQPFGLYTVAVPLLAPFPGYALAVFSLLALMPYTAAAALWLVLLVGSGLGAALLLATLCRTGIAGAIAVVTVAFAVAVIPYGQLTPIVLLALCGAALALRRNIVSALVVALAVVALEPNVALPVFVAVFLWRRDARIPLVILCAALLILHVVVVGPAGALAYFTQVLPAHDASEVRFVNQFSLTWMAQALGAPLRLSLVLGNVAYVLVCALGVWLAGALACRLRDPALLVLFPAACAVIGGSYVHYSEILLALPAALLLFAHSSHRGRIYAAFAVALIAIPWISIPSQPAVVLAAVGGVAAMCCLTLNLSVSAMLRAALGAALLCALILLAAFYYGPALSATHTLGLLDAGAADAARAAQIAESGASAGIVWWLVKLPTWLGLLALVLSGLNVYTETRSSLPGNDAVLSRG
ncbi:MAG TPA: glycosyltransferase 87 family protein [Candidatus Rubrimentiphilum sp.]|nr:glycosyltransferase 87 family protein [Candidatus Rubrimentiphilum sp.]